MHIKGEGGFPKYSFDSNQHFFCYFFHISVRTRVRRFEPELFFTEVQSFKESMDLEHHGSSRQSQEDSVVVFRSLPFVPEFGLFLELQPTLPYRATPNIGYVETFAPNVESGAKSTWLEVSASSCLCC